MEINELKYFLTVAKHENMHRASEEIGVSVGSLSKAISKIENELKVKLFKREGRNIKLSDYGKFLKIKGHELIQLETSIRSDILGEDTSFKIVIGASEILLSHYGVQLAKSIRSSYPNAKIELEVSDENSLISKVNDGEVDLGITTYDIANNFDKKCIDTIKFNTYSSTNHPLYKLSKKTDLSIHDVLKHGFIIPNNQLLGKVTKSDSKDGWRDDKFPRLVSLESSSLKTIENLVQSGEGLAYLPEYYAESLGLKLLNIQGCSFNCKQKVKVFTKDKGRFGWINNLF